MNTRKKMAKFSRLVLGRSSPLPEDIQIEITNRCDLACGMCPRDHLAVPVKDMPLDVFEKIVKRIPQADFVTLAGWGEPLMHPEFTELVKVLNRTLPDAMVKFTTNGMRLDQETAERVLERTIEQVSFSIDDFPGGPEEPDGGIGHTDGTKAVENVLEFIWLKGERPRPRIVLVSVMQKNGEDRVERLIRFAGKHLVDSVTLVRLDVRHGGIVRPSWEEERDMLRAARRLADELNVSLFCANEQGPILRTAGHFDRVCLRTDNSVYIDVEGNVAPCCNLRRERFGNILETELGAIWKGREFRRFRARQLKECGGCDALKYRYHHGEGDAG